MAASAGQTGSEGSDIVVGRLPPPTSEKPQEGEGCGWPRGERGDADTARGSQESRSDAGRTGNQTEGARRFEEAAEVHEGEAGRSDEAANIVGRREEKRSTRNPEWWSGRQREQELPQQRRYEDAGTVSSIP